MAIGNLTTSYEGRQIDIELLQSIVQPSAIQRVSISTVTKPPKIVAGVEKLVQRYALLFLTTLGDMVYAPQQGTDFLSLLIRGAIQDKAGLQTYFASANTAVILQLKADDANTTKFGEQSTDEQIATATLLNFDIDYKTSTVLLVVQLTTVAGSVVDFVIPATTIG